MREIRASYEGTLATVVIDERSFNITPKLVRKGQQPVFFELLRMRNRDAVANDVTDEELRAAARMLMELPGIESWAWSQS